MAGGGAGVPEAAGRPGRQDAGLQRSGEQAEDRQEVAGSGEEAYEEGGGGEGAVGNEAGGVVSFLFLMGGAVVVDCRKNSCSR